MRIKSVHILYIHSFLGLQIVTSILLLIIWTVLCGSECAAPNIRFGGDIFLQTLINYLQDYTA
jgi:hypothetical protein